MVWSEMVQSANHGRCNIGFTLIDGIPAGTADLIGDGHLGEVIERLKRNGIRCECDVPGIGWMSGIRDVSNPLDCALNGSGRNTFRYIEKIDGRNCRGVSVKRGLH